MPGTPHVAEEQGQGHCREKERRNGRSHGKGNTRRRMGKRPTLPIPCQQGPAG